MGKNESINVDQILPTSNNEQMSSLKKSSFGLIEKEEQGRLKLYHYVVHAIALIVIVPYVIMTGFRAVIPESYTTTVAIIIGFYFAKSIIK